MEIPRIGPVGIPEFPASYTASRRRIPVAVRVAAAVLIVVFALVVVSTTVVSVGRYCLTSQGADTRGLPGR